MSDVTIFEKIIQKKIPAEIVYEDEFTIAFKDIHPQAPVHVLVIPKEKIINIEDAVDTQEKILGKVLLTAKKVAHLMGVNKSGYRLVINNGEAAGQTVFYLHCHVLGGRDLHWPPG